MKPFPNLLREMPACWLLPLFVAVTFPFWGNGFLGPPDAGAYFAVPRTVVRDGDLEFSNDYEALAFQFFHYYRTREGVLSNDWPVGCGVVWLPAYALAEGVARGLEAVGVEGRRLDPEGGRRWLLPPPRSVGAGDALLAATGQSGIYKLAVMVWVAALSAVVLGLGAGMAESVTSRGAAVAGGLLLLLGTPVGFYVYTAPLMSHATSFALVGVLIWGWHRTRGGRGWREWALLGVVAGVMVMVRPQNAAFLVIFLVELAFAPPRGREEVRRLGLGILVAAAGAVAAFLPQMIVWGRLYGNALQLPKIEEMHWLEPEGWRVLFSSYHGLLAWSPVLALVVPGLVAVGRRDRVLAYAMGLAILLQYYLNAANEIWWAGGSFSNRRFVNCGVPFLIGLAGFWGMVRPWMAGLVAVPLAGWSLALWMTERAGRITLGPFEPWSGSFFERVGATLWPWELATASLGDLAGFGWGTRLVLVMGGSAAVVLLYRKGSRGVPRRLFSGLAAAGLVYTLVLAPGLMGLAAWRTASPDPASLDPRTPDRNISLYSGYTEYGFYAMVTDRVEEAVLAYEIARRLIPEASIPYRYLATLHLYKLDDPHGAFDLAEQALDRDPGYRMAARVYREAGGRILESEPWRGEEIFEKVIARTREAGLEEDAEELQAILDRARSERN